MIINLKSFFDYGKHSGLVRESLSDIFKLQNNLFSNLHPPQRDGHLSGTRECHRKGLRACGLVSRQF